MPYYPSQEEIDRMVKDAEAHKDDLCSIHKYKIYTPDSISEVDIDTGTGTITYYPGGN